MSEQKTNLMFKNIIASGKSLFSQQDSWLITQIVHIDQEITEKTQLLHFAKSLLRGFAKHDFYSKIDRICLAKVHLPAKELEVISSKNSDRVKHENIMGPGYRCYTNPEGSLFQMTAHQIRIFSKIDHIIDEYKANNKPPQRSIKYIHEMGFKSGICVPLNLSDHLEGFLFFNSVEPDYFSNLRYEDFTIISLLQTFASRILGLYNDDTAALFSSYFRGAIAPTTAFDSGKLQVQLNEHAKEKELPYQFRVCSNIPKPFLYSSTRLIYLLYFSMLTLKLSKESYLLQLEEDDGSVRVYYEHGLANADFQTIMTQQLAFNTIMMEASKMGMYTSIDPYVVEFSFPYDAAPQEVNYSV